MKFTGIKNFTDEYTLSLSLSIILWIVSLLVICLCCRMLFTDGIARRTMEDAGNSRYYEETVTVIN